MIFNILHQTTGEVLFSAEINCRANSAHGLKLGLAIRQALAKRVSLAGADLRDAGLIRADMRFANLAGANLSGADMQWADLGGTNLSGADMRKGKLGGANLRGADLRGSTLLLADLFGADLGECNMRGATLNRFDLWGAFNVPAAVKAEVASGPKGFRKVASLVKLRTWLRKTLTSIVALVRANERKCAARQG